jgi:hypothetical protein
MHVSKIQCDGESEKFCKIFWELNMAIVIVDPGEHAYMYDDMMHTFPALAIVASSYLTDHYRQYLSLIINNHHAWDERIVLTNCSANYSEHSQTTMSIPVLSIAYICCGGAHVTE